MTLSINLLSLKKWPISKQLELEEYLLKNNANNWCILSLYPQEAIVMGISNQLEQYVEPHSIHLQPIVRRFSGGGTVYIDHNTILTTFIMQSHANNLPRTPKTVLKWVFSLYQQILKLSLFNLQDQDFAINTLKIGGNAQYFVKKRWLHHTSLLWDFDSKKINRHNKHVELRK